jgi:hypothetical protein
MAREGEKKNSRAKISPGFAARLEQLEPKEKVRAILMLETGNTRRGLKRHRTKTTRQAAIKNTRQSVAEVLPAIDRILKRHRGKRLNSEINTLGAVPVITTSAGINALTDLEHVKAIFEDQAIFRVA